MLNKPESQIFEPKQVVFEGDSLTESQVTIGSVVAISLEGKTTIELDASGEPYLLMALMSGIPLRKKFLPLDNGIHDITSAGGFITAPLEGFLPHVRFVPIKRIKLG